MNKQKIIQICQKICNETNKYNKHSHELFHIYEKEIFEFTEDLVPKSEAVDGFGWTETLKNIDLDDLLNTINTLSNNIEYTTKLFKETFNLNYAENF